MYRLVWDIKLNTDQKNPTSNDHMAIADAILAGDVDKALKAYTKHHEHIIKTIAEMPDSAFVQDDVQYSCF